MTDSLDSRFWQQLELAITQPFEGWDFSFLNERVTEEALPWSYPVLAREYTARANCLLDMGTGGGELLASLVPFSGMVAATEAYPPNIPLAAANLNPHGISVVALGGDEDCALPFMDGAFDMILNRHDTYQPEEICRLLAPGGLFLTQQVGGCDNIKINEVLQAEISFEYADWLCSPAVAALEHAGFEILRQAEAFPPMIFHDICAVIFYLRVIPWQIADFSLEKYRNRLYDLHQKMEREGGFRSNAHRFLILARKPG